MRIRPLNDVVIVEPDPILKHEGMIVLSELNSVEKISPFATVVSYGPRCKHKYKVGQKVILPDVNSMNHETPVYFELDSKKYRMVRESRINAVIE